MYFLAWCTSGLASCQWILTDQDQKPDAATLTIYYLSTMIPRPAILLGLMGSRRIGRLGKSDATVDR